MNKQELARVRNWTKARISGLGFRRDGLTPYEQELVHQIAGLREKLLERWDERTVEMGLKLGSRYLVKDLTGGNMIPEEGMIVRKREAEFYRSDENFEVTKIN
jgi:hypothetical protein